MYKLMNGDEVVAESPEPITYDEQQKGWRIGDCVYSDGEKMFYVFSLDVLIGEITAQTQSRLDTWAKERNYDCILSLCTYATSSIPKFATEGQRGVDNRDATWAKLYEIMGEVMAAIRPMPSSFADIEPELPVLAWPSV